MRENFNFEKEHVEDDFQIHEFLEKIYQRKIWFLLGLAVSLLLSFIYIRYYAIPQYKGTATIMVKDEGKGGISNELATFADMGLISGKSNTENEVEVLKSRSLVSDVVKELRLNVSYYFEGRIKQVELYKNSPIEVEFLNYESEFANLYSDFEINVISPNKFKIEFQKAKDSKVYRFGEIINTSSGPIRVWNNKFNGGKKKNNISYPYSIKVVVYGFDDVVNNFRRNLNVNPVNKLSSVIEISVTDPIKDRTEDFINKLIFFYNDDAVKDKNLVSLNTANFIAERLELITKELDGVEKDVEGFKKENKLTDITAQSQLFIQNANGYENNIVEIETKNRIVSSLMEYLKKIDNKDLLPVNLITENGEIVSLISEYNKLVLERNRILKSSTNENPVILTLEDKLESLKNSISESLNRLKSVNKIKEQKLNKQENEIEGKITKIPVQERQFRFLQRQQQIKETLYLYLLGKREETALSLAVTPSNAKIIDSGKAYDLPIAPKKNIIYLGAILLGLVVPFSVFYVRDLMDNKVKTRKDIENKLGIPYLGDIPKCLDKDKLMYEENDRSSVSESLRIMLTNLEFMLSGLSENKGKTIFITSTVPKEGKTFLSINIANVLKRLDKKVLLIGMDIRNPRLEEYVDLPNKGLTNYITSKDNIESIENYIVSIEKLNNLDILPSGIIPPNPSQLLRSDKIKVMFDELCKKYDYIIVDTAPVSVVADTLQIAKYADTFVYVARANYLDKRLLEFPKRMYDEKKLPNMAIVLNDTDYGKQGSYNYYNYYGYGYSEMQTKKTWFNKFFMKD